MIDLGFGGGLAIYSASFPSFWQHCFDDAHSLTLHSSNFPLPTPLENELSSQDKKTYAAAIKI